jgi:hypothetical protein
LVRSNIAIVAVRWNKLREIQAAQRHRRSPTRIVAAFLYAKVENYFLRSIADADGHQDRSKEDGVVVVKRRNKSIAPAVIERTL